MTSKLHLPHWLEAIRFERWSFKTRLISLFSVLILIGTLFSSFILYQQHRLTVRSLEAGVQRYSRLDRATQLKETLDGIHRFGMATELSANKVARFQNSLGEMIETEPSPTGRELLATVKARFDSYLAVLGAKRFRKGRPELRARYEDVSASVSSY